MIKELGRGKNMDGEASEDKGEGEREEEKGEVGWREREEEEVNTEYS